VAERDRSEEQFNRALGMRLREARAAASSTQEQLARQVGLTRGSIANMERGEQAPTPYRLASIALVLHCPVERLIPTVDEWATDGKLSAAVSPVRQDAVAQLLRKAAQQRRRADG
jgi:transcriptional regulator with XRE-family HTH domain